MRCWIFFNIFFGLSVTIFFPCSRSCLHNEYLAVIYVKKKKRKNRKKFSKKAQSECSVRIKKTLFVNKNPKQHCLSLFWIVHKMLTFIFFLKDTLALICHTKPLETALRYLLEPSLRAYTATALNSALRGWFYMLSLFQPYVVPLAVLYHYILLFSQFRRRNGLLHNCLLCMQMFCINETCKYTRTRMSCSLSN